MDLECLTRSYVKFFDEKSLEKVGSLMSDNFELSDGIVNGLTPKNEVLSYIAKLMELNSKIFRFEALNVLTGEDFTILEFKLYLDDSVLHGVDLIHWCDGLMVNMKAFLNQADF